MLDRLGIGHDGCIQDSLVFDLAAVALASLMRPSMAGQSVPLGCYRACEDLSRRSIWFACRSHAT